MSWLIDYGTWFLILLFSYKQVKTNYSKEIAEYESVGIAVTDSMKKTAFYQSLVYGLMTIMLLSAAIGSNTIRSNGLVLQGAGFIIMVVTVILVLGYYWRRMKT